MLPKEVELSLDLGPKTRHGLGPGGWPQLHLAKNRWHWTVFFDPSPDFAIPRTSSKVVLRHQNAGPKMGPFSAPAVVVPIRERSSPFLNP